MPPRTLAAVPVQIYDTAIDVAYAATARLTNTLGALGDATLGLAGGSTPVATYKMLTTAAINWSPVTMWLGDERWVPPSHADSNTRVAAETLVDAVGGSLVVPEFGDDPVSAAAAYAEVLDAIWIDRNGHRAPDVVMLGIGDDGHTASLFPGTEALDDMDATYAANWVEAKQVWRLSATLPLLWSAREIMFLVTGEGKADVLARILDEEEPFPAQRVSAGAAGKVLWLVDAAAASLLQRPTDTMG